LVLDTNCIFGKGIVVNRTNLRTAPALYCKGFGLSASISLISVISGKKLVLSSPRLRGAHLGFSLVAAMLHRVFPDRAIRALLFGLLLLCLT
jgi:hypothetical protein